MRTGLYPMVADVLHTGHVAAIEEAKKKCDKLIVALHCSPPDKSPVQSVFERYMQLRAVRWVDEIVPYEDPDDLDEMLRCLDYDVYFLGEDYLGRSFDAADVLAENGKDVEYLKRQHKYSSTELKERIAREKG